MKVTQILVAVAFCVAAVNAVEVKTQPLNDIDAVEGSFIELVDLEARGSVSNAFSNVIKAALSTLKGINCSIKEVIAVLQSTQDFNANVNNCGTDAVKAYKDVITGAESVINISKSIIKTFRKDCESSVSNVKPTTPPTLCSVKMMPQLLKLRIQLDKTLDAIQNVPSVPAQAVGCTKSAVRNMTSAFKSFPSNMAACSKFKN